MKEALARYRSSHPDVQAVIIGTRRSDPHCGASSFRVVGHFGAIHVETAARRRFKCDARDGRRMAKVYEDPSDPRLVLRRRLGLFTRYDFFPTGWDTLLFALRLWVRFLRLPSVTELDQALRTATPRSVQRTTPFRIQSCARYRRRRPGNRHGS